MPLVEIKFDKHYVLKKEDINKYLTKRQRRKIEKLFDIINDGRMKDGKKVNEYIVCNRDEPYANDVYLELLKGEIEKGAEYKRHEINRESLDMCNES